MIRPRLRKFILIAGTITCLLLATAFVASAFWQAAFQIGGSLCVYVVGGSIAVMLDAPLGAPLAWERHSAGLFRWNVLTTDWRFFVELPLFALFAAVALLTLLVARFAPKFPRGHCRRCGYNLEGLTEARCPECGESFELKGDA